MMIEADPSHHIGSSQAALPASLPGSGVSFEVRLARLIGAAAFAASMAIATSASAGVFAEDDAIMIQAAPDTIHFNKSDEHAPYSWLVGAEWLSGKRWLAGYSHFNNSFGQRSHYIYGGYVWPIRSIDPNLYFKLTGGAILGYKKPYEDKIPFNNDGVAPGIIPGIGYQLGRFNVQLNLLGNAGLMFTFGYELLR